ncbi:MAG TPA: Xaa-Pro peptidase family protein [Terriglobales bacterium]|jgi:Xaa-Pro aminopeptidase|nr:Xaa-Pro peptidase family protein [Terriglobales bacterium]
MDYRTRQSRLLQSGEGSKCDVFLTSHLPNVRYLCGFTGSSAALALAPSGAVLFTDGRYTEQARAEVVGARVAIVRKSALLAAAEWVRKRFGRKRLVVGIEGDHLTVAARALLMRTLASRARLRHTAGAVERLRQVKDHEELTRMRAAAKLGASLFDVALRKTRPGVTEVAVAAEMEYAARRAGAEAMSFPTIVAAGPRTALPHAHPTAGKVPRNGFVLFDFGVILAGYCSDMTRTVCVGRPTAEARRFYEAVLEAQLAAIAAVRPGVAVGEVDRAARSALRGAGLARYFTHSTGHGVGLEIHEAPRVAAGQQERLQPGMVITVEPGVYLANRGGVRIEDMVVVTGSGCEVLTSTSKELIVL